MFATRIATGLSRPVYAHVRGNEICCMSWSNTRDASKTASLDDGSVAENPFLVVPRVSRGNEQGLLGLAFHPIYESN